MDHALIQMPVDEALSFIGKVPNEEFIKDAQKIQFNVRSPRKLDIHLQLDDFNKLVSLIQNPANDMVLLFCAIGLRRMLCNQIQPPIDAFIAAGLVQLFIDILRARDDFLKLQFEAAWCLTNVASGTSEHVGVLIEHGVVGCFTKFLASKHIDLVEQVVWGFGNIAGDKVEFRNSLIEEGIVDKINRILAPRAMERSQFVRNASWALTNLCR